MRELVGRMRMALRRRGSEISLWMFGGVAVAMLLVGTVLVSQGVGNLLLNVGSELVGTLLTIVVITPIVRAGQEGQVRSYPALNYRRFVDRSAGARSQVQILTTFSSLLKHRETDQFIANAEALLGRGVRVEVLLLHPDSLSAEQRQRELDGANTNVTSAILDNVQILAALGQRVAPDKRRYLAVRLYDASASVILHRWDDRGLISFLATDKLAEEGSHLEVDMRTPIGGFVEARFRVLWSHPRTITMERFLTIEITIVDAGDRQPSISARYVTLDGISYVVSSELLAARARRPNGSLRAWRDGDDTEEFDLVMMSRDHELQHRLEDAYEDKYGVRAHTLIRMQPLFKS